MHYQEIKHSSQLKSAGYDPHTQEMQIVFARNVRYIYFKVEPEVYASLIGSNKASDFFNANIKGKYEYQKAS